ncbi:MAG TPA: gliding motility-associated ABC transporter permease subunit GldF [Tenuifilaceae bacterium]|nr:gliding motility-associated ABC transporter permease subunit GldF [Tenuifilaceae bacterium]HPI46215.1 gliding motility-associated ABC transporter permease subunit GldF [Tenuifilaceae bacterium]HPN21599.1 gliding motility-associated ABC transporter permease subunit GldF [Tenuifilaceae bacterium]
MFAIFTKELKDFFSSLTGYISAIVFLLIIGLIMWVIPGDLNVLDSGYATLDSLFSIAPWVFLFLVPAVTMRTFSEEKRSGTIELILTRPISDTQMVLGKFFASVVLVLIILIPALLFYLSVYLLGNPVGNIDTGGTWGSFIGLFFLASAYAAVGIFTSSLTDNQIVSFILSMLLCFLLYTGLESLALLDAFSGIKYFLVSLSISEHYSSMSRGVIDTRDVVYFVALSALFLIFTRTKLESRKW